MVEVVGDGGGCGLDGGGGSQWSVVVMGDAVG